MNEGRAHPADVDASLAFPRSDDDVTVVGIGASAGGLEACRRLLRSLPAGHGMALILVRQLDAMHESLMADLPAGYTTMAVGRATGGVRLEPDHLYLLPPGTFFSVDHDTLRPSRPQARHGARLPFDVFLESLARSYGRRAVAVVLSGSGADGSAALKAVEAAGGFVVVQDPDEAGFDGMPRSAIATGAADLVLGVDRIGPALIAHRHRTDDPSRAETPRSDSRRIAALEAELDATRRDLEGAIRNLEAANEEQKIVNREALSANEELSTSKRALQSSNEASTALNGRLQETLERWRTTSSDLQNVLYSTDVATLFLDTALAVRFFTPATRSLFDILPSDVGRPLADLRFLATDDTLLADAAAVMASATPIEREIEAPNEAWFVRRVLPYRTIDDGIAGVVITFVDVTERRRTASALDAAKRSAELASIAKSRFLAAASHDLRQPLQTLCLLQGLLADAVEGDRAKRLVGRFEDALGAMTGMLDGLLDMNQIEAGTVRAEMAVVALDAVLARMASEFTYSAEAKGLTLRIIPTHLVARTDGRLLEQMLRNLVANALKYTPHGKVLVGCRRHGARLRIEVWDTGIGIAAEELQMIFEEYRQVDNAARDRSRGLGLGLSIVRRLGALLGHPVEVRSWPGRGSVFSIDVPLAVDEPMRPTVAGPAGDARAAATLGHRTGSILVVEDEPEVRDLLELVLERQGHRVVVAPDGAAALDLVIEGTLRPDLVLADFNLPGGLTGVEIAARLREKIRRPLPAIILTGDISTDTLRDIAGLDCLHLDKPVKAEVLAEAVGRLLASPPARVVARPAETEARAPAARVYLVDDDAHIRETMSALLVGEGLEVAAFDSCEAFLAAFRPGGEACLLIDAYLPGMSGLDLLRRLNREGHALPSIMITGDSDVPMAVQAMKAGASDFLEKPIARDELLAGVARALEHARDEGARIASRAAAVRHISDLTPRQIQIMKMVLDGHPSKNIAADLGISRRTVENHRAAIMRKTGARSLPALARLIVATD
ncbi:chemotaxis protein CheB [Pinisolibacter aquiterrae]|uniref:chemotaxis protein CheB n=1 Tax=Pinisolibacter aquiterrae TaxID=2815579 RepID=UPI001C3D1CF1|nr:chemotaxis protein CheB [Pinisolibacter aquiterrae]MBV5262504.1 response regulator [Pinisolibacter aquiterrae]MCC8235861.1 response regulator [Pinisolibacter aquiterrae]